MTDQPLTEDDLAQIETTLQKARQHRMFLTPAHLATLSVADRLFAEIRRLRARLGER